MRLSPKLDLEEAAGRTYDELNEDLQSAFLNYDLSIDLFVNATPREVREVFRRINSYEIPLNSEEQRHAQYQGAFKWFIYHLSHNLDQPFTQIGAFTSQQLVRMADMKLLGEITHALMYGVKVTNKKSLDDLYRKFDYEDDSFEFEEEFAEMIESALEYIIQLDAVQDSPLNKPYAIYSLILAVIHAANDVPRLQEWGASSGLAEPGLANERLSALAEAVAVKRSRGPNAAYVRASTKSTNTRDHRGTRLEYLLGAVSGG